MKKRSIGVYILIFVMVISLAWLVTNGNRNPAQNVAFSDFVKYLYNGQISQMSIVETQLNGTLKTGEYITAWAPSSIELMGISERYIFPQIEAGTLKLSSTKPSNNSWFVSILPTFLMILVFGALWFFFMQQSQGGRGMNAFGKSRAKLHKDDEATRVTFDDVAGLEEEKVELEEIVDFLRYPKKYVALGARIPKGILLVGPPGTGKTYISRATAGEAGVPFFSISGSDFVEMYVGVGASRVRDLFEQAKKNSPCIIFIDEIDAVGRRRGAGLGGGHDEREQTLNQLLVEMDGFGVNEGIIILAATNRPDILDPALLRPGRFDRQIVIGAPDVKGREAVFRVHAKNKPLDASVDLKVLAKRTPGFTPADIENMLNEAALLAARRNGKKIYMEEIEEAITKVMAGPEKKSRVMSDEEKRLTAYHEAGHAVAARLIPGSDPVHQITIIPRGRAGGFTMTLPEKERNYVTKTDMENMIVHLLGGRVAEKLVLGDISTGASNDLERATSTARDMITKYGMSERLGPINYGESEEVFLGRDFSSRRNYSEEIASEIDTEIRAIVENGFARCEQLLSENINILHAVAQALMEVETLDGQQFEDLFTGKKTPEELAADAEAAEEHKKNLHAAEAEEIRREREAEEAAKRAREGADQSGASQEMQQEIAKDPFLSAIFGAQAPDAEAPKDGEEPPQNEEKKDE